MTPLRNSPELDRSRAPVVAFAVEDQGVGREQTEIDGIFQPFRVTFAKGAGLVPAIVHRIVTDDDGEIRVASQPGKGATVEVRLPGASVDLDRDAEPTGVGVGRRPRHP